MTVIFRKTAQLANEIRMAAADRILHTLRALVTSVPKKAGKISLTNVRFELVENNPMEVTVGADTALETVSIRTVVSGSTLNEVAIRAAVVQHQLNFLAGIDDGALKGFPPANVTFVAKA